MKNKKIQSYNIFINKLVVKEKKIGNLKLKKKSLMLKKMKLKNHMKKIKFEIHVVETLWLLICYNYRMILLYKMNE